MIKYLASFKKANMELSDGGDASTADSNVENDATCNILLEFADMDLSVYFQNREPPTLSKEIEEFWRALFAVADVVRDIHNFKDDRGREYHG